MSERKDGGSAFPAQPIQHYPNGAVVRVQQGGMSLRDYFAAKAMQGLCANPSIYAPNPINGWSLVNCTDQNLTEYVYQVADAMLAARGVA